MDSTASEPDSDGVGIWGTNPSWGVDDDEKGRTGNERNANNLDTAGID